MKCGGSARILCANPERVERKMLMFNPFRVERLEYFAVTPHFHTGLFTLNPFRILING